MQFREGASQHDRLGRCSILWLAIFTSLNIFCLTKSAEGSIEFAHKHENQLVTNWNESASVGHKKHSHHFQQHHNHHRHYDSHQQPHKMTTKTREFHTSETKVMPTVATTIATATTSAVHSRQQHATTSRFSELSMLRNKCTLAERELDRCSAQLIGLGQTNAAYPDNMQELNSVYCPKFRETVSCVRNNTECYKPFEKQIINWILTSTRKMNYKRCKNENEKARFLRLTNSCFATMKNPMDDCMAKYIGSLDAIAEYNRDLERLSEDDYQIQLSCCANRRFKQCIMKSAQRSCQSHESLKKLRRTNSVSSQRVARKQLQRVVQDTMEDLKSTLDEMALTGPDFICTGVDEQFCRSRFDGRYLNRVARHKSIVPAMIKIYANK